MILLSGEGRLTDILSDKKSPQVYEKLDITYTAK